MRQLTIAERLTAAIALPLAALLSVPILTGALALFVDKGHVIYAEAFLASLAVALATVVIVVFARGIARPLAQVADTIDAIAYAELDSAEPSPTGRGEITRLIAATDRLAEVIGERQRRELVHNDLDRAWQAARRNNLSTMARQVESATEVGIQPIVDGAASLHLKADDMLAALETVRAAFDETVRAAESSHAMNLAACRLSDQVIGAIGEISEQVRIGSGLGREAVARANASRGTIDALARAADQIGDIVTVINTIASQTNLLALNATIEAARAGEAGRGFAVVASEVKTLATQTGKSTGQIGAKVAEIQAITRDVVAALSSVAEAVDQLSDVTVSVSAAIEQQRDATANFAGSARETTAATSDVVGRMSGIADMVSRSRTTAQDVATVVAAVQSTSQILCREIPEIVRKAVKADLREFPRYEVTLKAQLQRDEQIIEVTVLDISEGGARIQVVDDIAVGERLAVTFPGMKAIAAEVLRKSADGLGLCFTPACLRLEELRDLVTSPERAA